MNFNAILYVLFHLIKPGHWPSGRVFTNGPVE